MAAGAPESVFVRSDVAPLGAVVLRGDRLVRLAAAVAPVDGVVTRECAAPFGGVALHVAEVSRVDATGATPPSVEWSLRARFGGRSEEVASGTATWPDGWESSGLLVQVANRIAEGWELWARATLDGGVSLALRWAVVPASSLAGAPAVTVGVL